MDKRLDMKKIMADPVLRAKVIAGVVRFCCALEGHNHEKRAEERVNG